jgi:hypothetical protein
MEYPDQLKKPAPTRHPGFDALDGFLWEAASRDAEVEQALLEFRLDGPEPELAEAAQRLLDEGLLAEPGMVYRAMRLLADVGALSVENLGTRAGRSHDPLRLSGPAIGRGTEHFWGVGVLTRRRSGISMVCITGPAGVGKTRLAEEIAAECEQKGNTPRLEVRLSRPATGVEPQQWAVNSYDALLDLVLQLGVTEADIPAAPAERKARYTSELAGQRPVILIDGAIAESQVLDLLPPADGAVVVTSRRHLPGLYGEAAEYIALKPLSTPGLLIKRCFEPRGVAPDDAAITAISAAGGGMPVPTMVLSHWMATAAKNELARAAKTGDPENGAAQDEEAERVVLGTLGERLRAAVRNLTPVAPGLTQAEEIPAPDAMAAAFSLLNDDQRAVMRGLGLLRLPETGILVMCLASGLSEDRARAALEQLADMGLIARAGSGRSWIMDPHVADYAHADALSRGQLGEPGFQEMLGRVIDVYRVRTESLRDLMSAPCPEQARRARLHEWLAAEWEQERDSIAAVLNVAAACTHPAVARDLAAVFMDVSSWADGSESGWRETGRYLASILVIARAADDHGLGVSVLRRFAGDAERQGDTASADALRNAAHAVREGHDYPVHEDFDQEPGGEAAEDRSEDPVRVPAPPDGLGRVERTVQEAAVTAPGPVIFGTKAYRP